ncbi:MAG: hypothetical protein IT462_00880 [Planctomycetes bacterium]|nr:hypothetical protein [Planctomycetota bacterium]
MEPTLVYNDAVSMVAKGDLQAAVEQIDSLLTEYPTFGPAYTAHAQAFLIAGDSGQALVDLAEAEKHDRAHGTPEQLARTVETRMLVHALRTMFGGKIEADRCRQVGEELKKLNRPDENWFIPAAVLEHDYREPDAQKWVEGLSRIKELGSPSSMYFTKRAGITQLLLAPQNPKQMVPVHFARYQRAKREGDVAGAKKHLKRLQDLVRGLEPYAIIARFANNELILRDS